MSKHKGSKRIAKKYVVIPNPLVKGEFFWQLLDRADHVLLTSTPFPSEREAKDAAREDSRRRQVIEEDSFA